MPDGADNTQNAYEVFRIYLAEQGLKSTRQRDLIARVFFRTESHLNVDELLRRVRRIDPRISQATVYRTLKLLKASGLAAERHFGDGQARYEVADEGNEHHDHLICVRCGKIVEFVNPRIEALQDQVAGEHGFKVTQHKMELYGICPECQAGG